MSGNPREPRAATHTHSPADTEQCVKQTLTTMQLDALRDRKQLTQSQMAQLLKVSQGAVSKVERRTDMFISTLRNYLRAIGGDLQIRAIFPEGDVLIDQFDVAKQPEGAAAPISPEGQSDTSGVSWPVSSSGSAKAGPEAE